MGTPDIGVDVNAVGVTAATAIGGIGAGSVRVACADEVAGVELINSEFAITPSPSRRRSRLHWLSAGVLDRRGAGRDRQYSGHRYDRQWHG